MLRGHTGRQLMGSFDLRFDHQKSEGSLKRAADSLESVVVLVFVVVAWPFKAFQDPFYAQMYFLKNMFVFSTIIRL